MKRVLFITIAAALFVIGCKKDETWSFGEIWKGSQEYGYVQALRNGEKWEASAIAVFREDRPKHCEINFLAYFQADTNILAESLGLILVPVKIGVFNVYNTIGLQSTSWADSTSGIYGLRYDDQPRATYFPYSNPFIKNQIWVDEVDSKAGTISGRFDVTFLIDKEDSDTKYPHVIRFSDGVFKTKFR
jgi:hypothetical protein